jgi:very-short-patch-repair endonuclease
MNKKLTASEIYNKNPNICPYCGGIVPYKKNKGKFCNRKCANNYTNKFIIPKTTKKNLLEKTDWSLVQQEHNNWLHWSKIPSVFNFSMTLLKRAEKEGVIKKILHIRKHSDDVKSYMSFKRKEFLKNNPHKHHWRTSDKYKSVPCETLKLHLIKNGINFIEEYMPLEDRSFSIDIAFPDKKIGIEVNGTQHYNSDKTLKKYYQDRKNLIEEQGWVIFDVHYKKVFDEKFISSFIDKIKEDYNLQEVDYSFYIKGISITRVHGTRDDYNKFRVNSSNDRQKDKIELVHNSNINFEKFGWTKEVSELIGLRTQKVSHWMKKYLPELYETRCYKKIDRFGLSNKKIYGSIEVYKNHRKCESLKLTDDRIKLIKEHNMSLSDRGWSIKLGLLFNIERTTVCNWVMDNKEYILSEIKKNENK